MISARVAAHFSASPGCVSRGPSAMTKSLRGLALAISAKTRFVVSVRLKIINATGVSMIPPFIGLEKPTSHIRNQVILMRACSTSLFFWRSCPLPTGEVWRNSRASVTLGQIASTHHPLISESGDSGSQSSYRSMPLWLFSSLYRFCRAHKLSRASQMAKPGKLWTDGDFLLLNQASAWIH